MKNLKDSLTTIAGVVGAVAGSIIIAASGGLAVAPAILIGAKTVGVVSGAVIAYFTGKNPDGSPKSDTQVSSQNSGK